MAERVRLWMEGHEATFRAVYGFVKTLQAEERPGRVRDRVATWCVGNDVELGDAFFFDNTYWAGVSRYLVLHDPSLDGAPIVFRDSDIDCYGLLPVSYLPQTQGRGGIQ